MWARLNIDNTVAELVEVDPDGRFHPDLIWVPCPIDTVVGGVIDAAYTPERTAQLEAAAQLAADISQRNEAKADAAVQHLVTHSPAEINAYVRGQVNAAGVTNLATAVAAIAAMETLLVKLAVVASVSTKDKLR